MHHHIHPGGSQMEKPYGYAEMTDPHPVTGQPGSRDDPQPPEGEGSGATSTHPVIPIQRRYTNTNTNNAPTLARASSVNSW